MTPDMMPPAVAHYLKKRGVASWSISGNQRYDYAGVIVIPALAESPRLFDTLESLAQNPGALLDRFLVLVVVNHRQDAPAEDKVDNAKTLGMLEQSRSRLPMLNLAWIDAASPGLEMPIKGGGVGLARKIGADLALPCLDYSRFEPLIVYLDADTVVQPDYLSALISHFDSSAAGGATIPFRHQAAVAPEQQHTIEVYELFLRAYVLGLEIAGSPYAFHTVGSAMACRALDYARMGGMNTRAAGEDFYFLQQLHRVSKVAPLRGTVVYPSPRPSHRVPFGTGRSMSRVLAGEENVITFHRTECFLILRAWLVLVAAHPDAEADSLLDGARAIAPELAAYLVECRFAAAWEKLRLNTKNNNAMISAFHGWFDGLKTMKLIHHLSHTAFPCCSPESTMESLLALAGVSRVTGITNQLKILQQRQFAC